MSKQSILVVDDEVQILNALEDLLEDDFTVFTETSAEHALDLAKQVENLSVVISDQRMPHMPGNEFLSLMRKLSEATRILLTGYADHEAVVDAVNKGQIFSYLSKPWDPDQVRLTVQRAAQYYEMQRKITEAHDLLYNLMDSQPDAVYFKDAEHRYLHLNRAELQFLNVGDLKDALGKTPNEVMPHYRANEIIAMENKVLRSKQPVVDEISEDIDSRGIFHWYSTSLAPVTNEQGEVHRLVGITREVTKHHWIEKQHQLLWEITRNAIDTPNLEATLQVALKKICSACDWCYCEAWMVDEEQHLVQKASWLNENQYDFAQGSPEGPVDFEDLDTGIAEQAWKTQLPVLITTQSPPQADESGKYSALTEAGIQAVLAVPVLDPKGSIMAVLVFYIGFQHFINDHMTNLVTNVATQIGPILYSKVREAQQTQWITRYHETAKKTVAWVWETDEDLCFNFISPHIEELMGFTKDHLIGTTLFQLLENAAARHRTMLVKQKPFSDIPCTLADAAERPHHLLLSGEPVFSPEGELRGYRGVAWDKTTAG